jgi:outer membrane protein TolC
VAQAALLGKLAKLCPTGIVIETAELSDGHALACPKGRRFFSWQTSALALGAVHGGAEIQNAHGPVPSAFKEAPPASFKEGDGWKTAQPADQTIRGNWWELFGDPQLNTLEQQLTLGNQDLKAAEARFREARAMIRSTGLPCFRPSPRRRPSRRSACQATARSSPPQPPASGDFVLPFDLSYEVDLWGRVRRTVNAAREEAQATAADLETASLSLHAELAYDYFELRAADSQQRLLDDTVKAYTETLRLTTTRFEGGAAPKSDVAQAQTQLDTTRVADTDIGVQRAQYEHAIAILLGKPPAEFSLAA